MTDSVIRVDHLGKRYRIGSGPAPSLREQLSHLALAPFRLLSRRPRVENTKSIFWALKDVSFEVGRGEVLGIVGRNGAGKSTLLKILSRITEPTTGTIDITGRIASLLEVGTGFHGELTGRENVFLNGAILGMTREEVRRKFDEIVAFAEIGQFIDTAVKHYSSGMYVRLAFAVAAHLEPEILIVDEVLAVGDIAFQRKCLGRIKEVAHGEGRTVLFVSHNMSAVESLCSHGLYLRDGQVVTGGDVDTVIARYATEVAGAAPATFVRRELSPLVTCESIVLSPNPVVTGEPVTFDIELSAKGSPMLKELAFLLFTGSGTKVALLDLRRNGLQEAFARHNRVRVRGRIPNLNLVAADYSVALYINCADIHGDSTDLCRLSVLEGRRTDGIAPYQPQHRGFVELDYEFSFDAATAGEGRSVASVR